MLIAETQTQYLGFACFSRSLTPLVQGVEAFLTP